MISRATTALWFQRWPPLHARSIEAFFQTETTNRNRRGMVPILDMTYGRGINGDHLPEHIPGNPSIIMKTCLAVVVLLQRSRIT